MLLAMFALFACMVVRPVVFRPLAIGRRAGDSSTIVACWMLVGSIVLLPIQFPLIEAAIPTLEAKPWLILLGFAKGFVIWLVILLDQYMRKVSSSSAVFKGFPALALLAMVNVGFLGEVLNLWQWFSVLSLAALGLAYALRGHLSSLSGTYKLLFLLLILLSVLPGIADVLVIGQTNWYVQFVTSSFGLIFPVLLNKRSRNLIKVAFTKRDCAIMGSVFLITEIIILFLLVTHISVTMGVLAMRLAIPSTMLISALLWQEGRWQSQLLFGVLAYLCTLPIILF